METWKINGYTLEYDDESHTYLVDGVIVPSVTQVLGVKFGNKYNRVSAEVLNRAAVRGTNIHKAIENYCKGITTEETKELHNFKFLMKYYKLKVLENETPILICIDDKPVAAGRLDLILDQAGESCVADIKTTYTLDKNYLAYQLNLYRLGYMQSYGINITKLYGVHLKENTRKLVSIPINEALAWEILKDYERKYNNE